MTTPLRPYPPLIGPYRVLRPIGRGGAAAVYEVEHPRTGEHQALKLLTHALSSVRFEREYRTLATLNHPNIVRVYDYGFTDDSYPYLTMELLDGVPAQAHAKACGRAGATTRTAEVLRIGALVADALGYLHQHHIVHRDLKSSNVLVLSNGGVKLLDLGTARLLNSNEGITRQGEFIGTFTYASPEQLTGQQVDHRSDLYSLGVLLYRLLTGRRPFEIDDPQEQARHHIEVMPMPPMEAVPSLPPPLSAFVMQLLAKRPDERPPSARLVSETLRHSGLATPPLTLGPPWVGTLPLVGRAMEMGALSQILDQAIPGSMLILLGPAGSGRGRLIEEAVARAHNRGAAVHEAAFPGPSGLGALVQVAWSVSRDLSKDGHTDPSFATLRDASPSPPAAARLVLFLELLSMLRQRSGADGRSVLVAMRRLDRARHLALQAIQALRMRAAEGGIPLLFVGSAEADANGDPPAILRHAFPEARWLRVPPLSPAETGLLVSAMLGTDPPPPQLSQRLHEATGGWPGRVEALVRAGARAGAKARGRLALPPSVGQAIGLHLQNLSRVCGRVCEALTVAGGEANTDLLSHVSGLPSLELRAGLLALVRERIVESLDDGGVETWRFRLSDSVAVVAATLTDERQDEMRERVAASLATAPPTANKVRLLVASRHIEPAISEAVPWAERWLEDGQPTEVLGILAPLVDRAQEAPTVTVALLARLFLCYGRALTAVDPEDPTCDRALAQAMAMATEPARRGEVDLYTAALYRRRGQVDRARGRLARANRLLEAAQAPRLRALARLYRGADALERGDLNAAAQSFEEARKGGERSGDLRCAARARLGSCSVLLSLGELDDTERHLNRVGASLARNQDDRGQWAAARHQTLVMRLQGRFSEARRTISRHREAARLTGHGDDFAALVISQVEIELDLGRWDEAQRLVAQLDALGPPTLSVRLAAGRARSVARLLLAQGRRSEALDMVEAPLELARAQGLAVPAAVLTAWRGVATRDVASGEEDLLSAVQQLQAVGHRPGLVEAVVVTALHTGAGYYPVQTLEILKPWAEAQSARGVRLVLSAMAAQRAAAAGDRAEAAAHARDAEAQFQTLEGMQETIDREALAHHPWRRRWQEWLQV